MNDGQSLYVCPHCNCGWTVDNMVPVCFNCYGRLRSENSTIKRQLEEARAALSGRTVSCVCGGVGADERRAMERVRAALVNIIWKQVEVENGKTTGAAFPESVCLAGAALSDLDRAMGKA